MTGILLTMFILQGQAFKDFDQDAKKALGQQNYTRAFELFQEAYRLQPKAKKYRVEGNYIDSYLPLYSMALCQEHIDIIAAGDWAQKSQTALEYDVLKKTRKALAKYHKNIRRILKKAEMESSTRKRAFMRKLEDAEALLRKQQFEAARKAYEALELAYPDRTEPRSGRQSVELAENQFLNNKAELFKMALDTENVTTCNSLLKKTQSAFPDRDLSSWRSDIEQLRKTLSDREEREKLELEKQKTAEVKHQPQPPVQNQTIVKKVEHTDQDRKPALGHNDNSRSGLATIPNREQIRLHLLDSLAFYKRSGDSKLALEKLIRECPEDGIRFPSYHWIHAILLAALYDETGNKDTLKTCEMEIQTVLSSDVRTNPESGSYSATFLNIYQRAKTNLKP